MVARRRVAFCLLRYIRRRAGRSRREYSTGRLQRLRACANGPNGDERSDRCYGRGYSQRDGAIRSNVRVVFNALSELGAQGRPIISLRVVQRLDQVSHSDYVRVYGRSGRCDGCRIMPGSNVIRGHDCRAELFTYT